MKCLSKKRRASDLIDADDLSWEENGYTYIYADSLVLLYHSIHSSIRQLSARCSPNHSHECALSHNTYTNVIDHFQSTFVTEYYGRR